MDTDSDILTAAEVAGRLRMHVNRIYLLAAAGLLPAWKLGGLWRFSWTAIQKRLEGNAHG